MLIDGPFDLQIIETDGSRELHISCKEAYQALDLASRVELLQQHLRDLEVHYLASSDPAEQQGMQMIMQVIAQILPLIEADEISLEESIVLELGASSQISKLIDDATLN